MEMVAYCCNGDRQGNPHEGAGDAPQHSPEENGKNDGEGGDGKGTSFESGVEQVADRELDECHAEENQCRGLP